MRGLHRQRSHAAGLVVVTGAGGGLGRALCLESSRHGYTVVGVDRNERTVNAIVNEIRGSGHEAVAVVADIASIHDCQATARFVLDELGPVDILVNNAGVSQRKMALETELGEMSEIFAVNFFGTVQLTGEFLPHMIGRGRGSIVTISSVVAGIPNPLESAYCASKAALSRWSHSLTVELHGTGVRAKVINPGPMATAMWMHDETASPYEGKGAPQNNVVVVTCVEVGSGGWGLGGVDGVVP